MAMFTCLSVRLIVSRPGRGAAPPRVSQIMFFLCKKKLPREIHASGGGLLVASINASHLFLEIGRHFLTDNFS